MKSEHLEHNSTLDGLEANAFRGVSLYLGASPERVQIELSLMQDGAINDSQRILENNKLEIGSGKPVINIHNTKEINVSCKE